MFTKRFFSLCMLTGANIQMGPPKQYFNIWYCFIEGSRLRMKSVDVTVQLWNLF